MLVFLNRLRALAVPAALATIAAVAPPVHAQSAKWNRITQPAGVPAPLRAALSDCSYLSTHADNWPNGENLASSTLGDGTVLWFSTCETSASQSYIALVLQTGATSSRLSFPYWRDVSLQTGLDVVADATW